MKFDFWLVLLAASFAQCLFLVVAIGLRGFVNRKAKILLLLLLGIVACTLFSNAWTALYLYRSALFPSLFTRGMVLLLGPVCYFYTIAVTKPHHHYKVTPWVHVIPYLVITGLNLVQMPSLAPDALEQGIDQFLSGKAVIDTVSYLQFVLYSAHLSVYLFLSYHTLKKNEAEEGYVVPIRRRARWLRLMGAMMVIVPLVFAGICLYIMVRGTYTIEGNIVYTTALSLLVYAIAFQAMQDHVLLAPGFEKKYGTRKVDTEEQKKTLAHILQVLSREEVYTDPKLTLNLFSQKAALRPYTVSRIVNECLQKSFTELVNEYRIELFRKKLMNPDFSNYSIYGLASEVGYQSKSTFNTAFKKIMNQTPSEYLQQAEDGLR